MQKNLETSAPIKHLTTKQLRNRKLQQAKVQHKYQYDEAKRGINNNNNKWIFKVDLHTKLDTCKQQNFISSKSIINNYSCRRQHNPPLITYKRYSSSFNDKNKKKSKINFIGQKSFQMNLFQNNSQS